MMRANLPMSSNNKERRIQSKKLNKRILVIQLNLKYKKFVIFLSLNTHQLAKFNQQKSQNQTSPNPQRSQNSSKPPFHNIPKKSTISKRTTREKSSHLKINS